GGYTRFRGPDLASSGLYILGGGGISALDSDRSLALSKVRHKSGTGRNRGVLSDEPVGMVELVYGSFISVCSADVDPYGCEQFARSPHSAHGSVDHRAFRGNGGGRLSGRPWPARADRRRVTDERRSFQLHHDLGRALWRRHGAHLL